MDRYQEHPQTRGEELANSISHGAAVAAICAVAPWLIITAIHHGSVWSVVAISIFIVSIALLYLASTLYHAISHQHLKNVFRMLDHSAIFLLIAGTYTPFTLGLLRGGWGWSLFGIIWGLAIIGIVLKNLRALWHPLLSNSIYLGMSWLIVIAIWPLWQHVPHIGLLWLLVGGIAYTGGIWFYNTRKLKYAHLIWHTCVIIGTLCHVIAVLKYVA